MNLELIDNKSKTLKDDLTKEIIKGRKLSIAAACFPIYAFQELKAQFTNKIRRNEFRRTRSEGIGSSRFLNNCLTHLEEREVYMCL